MNNEPFMYMRLILNTFLPQPLPRVLNVMLVVVYTECVTDLD